MKFLEDIQNILQPYPGRGFKDPVKIEAASGIVNKARGKKGIKEFQLNDYSVTPGSKFDKILQKIQKAGGDPKDFKNSVLGFRKTIDNMSLKLLQKNLPSEIAETMQKQIGNYLTAEYKQFNQMPFFGHKATTTSTLYLSFLFSIFCIEGLTAG